MIDLVNDDACATVRMPTQKESDSEEHLRRHDEGDVQKIGRLEPVPAQNVVSLLSALSQHRTYGEDYDAF